MAELFTPQKLPKITPRASRPADRQVIEWDPNSRLPWVTLQPPTPLGKTKRVWRHTVYLGVYELEATYSYLREMFGEGKDAYDERPRGKSACAAFRVNSEGRLEASSMTLSSALWAVGQIHATGPGDGSWVDKFPAAQEALREGADVLEGKRRSSAGSDQPPAQDGASLWELLRLSQNIAGVAGHPRLATQKVLIESEAVSARRTEETGDLDFLNSFFLDELSLVRSAIMRDGCDGALAAYLTRDTVLNESARIDVIQSAETTDRGVSLERLPKGRWPSEPEHGLALRQQFAVNYALNDLAAAPGLMGVNGPPGTGKTTMLRDILAGNVVERARELAKLERTEDAFTAETHRWKAGDYIRLVPQLRPELTGYEMVVASANNAAVENITTEIPARKAVGKPWHDEADYFADIATAVLGRTDARTQDGSNVEAWGMVAARLGNKGNREAFRSAFWFDGKDPSTEEPVEDNPLRMQSRLTHWSTGATPHKSWREARKDFAAAEERVDALLARRRSARDRRELLPQAQETERAWLQRAVDLRNGLHQAEAQMHVAQERVAGTREATTRASTLRQRHLQTKPGILEAVFTLGRAIRDWRAALHPLDESLQQAENSQALAETQSRDIVQRTTDLRAELKSADASRQRASSYLEALRRQIDVDEAEIGASYPGDAWTGEVRELHAPWLDAELDAARSELFLAALQLHEDFCANAAQTMLGGLRAALEVVAGSGPHDLDPEKRRAAWQLFFLLVPLVSTTFASFGKMFGEMGPASIGWVLVDEAGQAPPQCAVGAVWRAQRVIAVGDPLQLQPVVTIPPKAQRDIASVFGVSETWMPPRASVQTLADRVSRYGTTLVQDGRPVWVSAPLTVHRRCAEPMFSLCNEIAYNGIMVNGVKPAIDDPSKPGCFDTVDGPRIKRSQWLDEPALSSGTHLQENQIARLEAELADLKAAGIDSSKVIAISPFRPVADRLSSLAHRHKGLSAGTIHTAQGREAPVVFLVLGGDPAAPGAKRWAAATVNLVNVAASRAQRRLYVIGDRAAWEQHNYFRELAAFLSCGVGDSPLT